MYINLNKTIMRKEKYKLLRIAMLCMVMVLSASKVWSDNVTSVSYVDENYATQTVDATILDATMTNLTPGYYVVPAGGLTFPQPISCTEESEAPLVIIIPDGATLTIGTAGAPITGSIALNAPNCKLGLYGQANATGKIVVNAAANAGAISSLKYVAIAHLDVTCSDKISVLEDGTGCTISGHQTNGNTVAVKTSGSYGLNVATSLTINNCDLDVEAGLTGINVWGTGLFITGKADGSNTVKVVAGNDTESTHYGISSDCPLIIKNCSVDVSVAADYSTVGISANNITIEGIAAGTNTLTVRDCMYGLDSRGNAVTLSNLDVDIISKYTAIGAGGSGKLTITGRTTGTPNLINVTSSNSSGINFSGGPAEISNCDIVVNSQGNGFNGGGSPLTITGRTTGTPNKIIVTTTSGDGFYLSSVTTTISDCDVVVNSGGIGFNGGGSPLTITGRTTGTPNKINVTTTSGNGFSLGSVTTTISNCDIEVNSGSSGFTGGGGDLIITGRATADTPNHIYVTSSSPGINFSGKTHTTISNCDIVVNSQSIGFNGGGGYLNIIGRTMGTPNQVSVTSSNSIGFQLGGVTTTINGCDVIVNSYSDGFITSGSPLTITGRTTGTHNKIKVKSNDSKGIGGNGANIKFSSCDVEMNGKVYGMYQSGGSFTFNNSNVTVVGVKTAIHNNGGNPVVITDSKLTATCTGTYEEGGSTTDYCGIYAWGVNIEGSQVTVNAPNGYKGIYIYNSINLDWKHEDDFIYASSYGGNEYALFIKAVHPFLDYYDDSKVYYGNISVTRDDNDYIISTPIDGVKLVPVGTILSLDAGKFMTFYSDKHNLTVYDADIQLATITGVSGQTATATRIQSANKKMPFLIYNNSDETKEFILFPTDNVRWLPIYSGFKGTATDKAFSAAEMAATDHYILQDNAFYLVKSAGTIAAQRCWLEKAKSGSAASRLNIVFDEATAIDHSPLTIDHSDGTLYDLNGRKMVHGTSSNGTLPKGLYIQNGKKIIVK